MLYYFVGINSCIYLAPEIITRKDKNIACGFRNRFGKTANTVLSKQEETQLNSPSEQPTDKLPDRQTELKVRRTKRTTDKQNKQHINRKTDR